MDLTRTLLIDNSTNEQLIDVDYLENLIIRLGFNRETMREQPKIVKDNGGGLLIWQYPNQFSKYLELLHRYKISSYIEIGCRWGGTYVLTTEYLKRFNDIKKSVAVDISEYPLSEYCKKHDYTYFIKIDSGSDEFKKYLSENKFDLIFIDGDHSYEGVSNDFAASKDTGKIFVFHDIVNAVCPGVVRFWNELKESHRDKYDFFEFTEQYDDVRESTGQTFLGIGVAVSKGL